MRVVLGVVLCLVVVCCGKTNKKVERLCNKNRGTMETSCVLKGYQPPLEISCHFNLQTPTKGKKQYKKKKCSAAADYILKNCPELQCGTTTTTPTPTTYPCMGGGGWGTSSSPSGSGPCDYSIPTTPEGGYWEE